MLSARAVRGQDEILPDNERGRSGRTAPLFDAGRRRSADETDVDARAAIEAIVSPDDKWIADIYSYTNKPPELFVMENRPGAEAEETHVVAGAGILDISVARCAHRSFPGA